MKVLMLNGSGNANGSTRAGLDIMADVFATEGIETEIVCVGAKPVRDCLGCGKCAEKGKCVFQDDGVNDFVEKAATADGFIFGTPVYFAHPRPQHRKPFLHSAARRSAAFPSVQAG